MDYPYSELGPTLEVVSLAMLLVMAVVGAVLVVYLASLPGGVARSRNHPQARAISVLGWLGLPSGLLWIVALVWAYGSRPLDSKQVVQQLDQLESAITQLERAERGLAS